MKSQCIPSIEIQKYLDDHDDELQYQECNKSCHPKSTYQTFSTSPAICTNALLCEKVHVSDLDLPKLDINFRELPGEVNKFHITPRLAAMVHTVVLRVVQAVQQGI